MSLQIESTVYNPEELVKMQRSKITEKVTKHAQKSPVRHKDKRQQHQHLAYKHFGMLKYGFLGQHVQVTLPNCVIDAIRAEGPDQNNYHVEFCDSILNV